MTPDTLAAVRAEVGDHVAVLPDAKDRAIARHYYLLACELVEKRDPELRELPEVGT